MKNCLTCCSIFTAFMIVTAEAPPVKLNYTRNVEDMNWCVKRENKALSKIKVYAERQPYKPNQNYLNRWIDRPLFEDVSLRSGDFEKKRFS